MNPLINRLKRQMHREIAKAQDVLVETLYGVFPEAVLHGGTALWRCYQGNRFSEDLDVYLPKERGKIDLLFEKFKRRGFSIEKKKIGENSLYSRLQLSGVSVRFEAVFKKNPGHLQEYETAEGNFLTVLTLTPEELVQEKVPTYLKRRKIRDLYDIFFLLRHVQDREMVKKALTRLFADFKPPIDEKELALLILSGLVPTTKQMLDYLHHWE
ncbi:MAG: nucleotidyl transferase AbiEii/AbiGii toxin family protein [Nanoarchaeota archaeon]|nr:nucleotidyl transferase AbiEii/AbiGii toxin family protein [Nanoarchaeota archaeon]